MPDAASKGEPRIPQRRERSWGSFAYRDYRLIWSGQLVSNLGFWMQFTSLTYFVGVVLADSAAHSSLNLALLGLVRSIPTFVFAPIAGYVADRYSRRTTLFLTNLTQALLAVALAVVSHGRGPLVLALTLVIAAAFSGAQAFDNPARQSWVPTLVPRQLLSNAIGLMSLAGNAPLLFGPAVAGILIGTVSISVTFLVQAVTQWGAVIAVILMRPPAPSVRSTEPILEQIVGGIRFLMSHAILRWIVFMLLVTCFCVRPYTWLLATLAGHVLHVDARAYGMMLTVGGFGVVSGALTTATFQTERRTRIWFISGIVCAGGLVVLAFVPSYAVILVILTFMGWGTMSFTSSTNVMLQVFTPEGMRGRAMSIYNMVQNGFIPIGTLVLGTIASLSSLPVAYAAAGITALVAGIAVWVTHPALRRA